MDSRIVLVKCIIPLLKKVPKAHFNPGSNSQLCEDFATENARLRRENERLRMLREILKDAAHLLGTAEMKFRLIEDQRGTFPVRVFCGVPGVSAAGYYAWRRPPKSPCRAANRALLIEIRNSAHRS